MKVGNQICWCFLFAAKYNQVQFYDAVENPDELSSDEDDVSQMKKDPRLDALQVKLSALFRKRAHLRNKKVKTL